MSVIALGVRHTRTRFVFQISETADHPFALGIHLQPPMTIGIFHQQAGCGDLVADALGSFRRTDLETKAGKDRVITQTHR